MTDLHELEQKYQDKIPHHRHADDRDVLVERMTGDQLLVASTDGQLIGPFAKGRKKIVRGKNVLTQALTPFDIHTKRRGKVEIRKNTKFYWEDQEYHIKADSFKVDEDGRIYVRFRTTDVWYPRPEWVFTTEDIARLIEEEQLRTAEEIDERAREALEGFQS